MRLVSQFMWSFSLDNQPLELKPIKLFLVEADLFFFLSLLILQEQDSYEEIEEEKAPNKNENYEKQHLSRVSFIFWPVVPAGDVNGLVHYLRPAF